jgi:hypothetical protein
MGWHLMRLKAQEIGRRKAQAPSQVGRTCATGVNCGETLSERNTTGFCSLCSKNISRWAQRKPAEIMERKRALSKYSDRMDLVSVRKQ